MMPLTLRVLVGLIGGFLLGLALAGQTSGVATTVVAVAVPVGALFINLIRMTVVPLVASMLISSIGACAFSGTAGRAAARALALVVALLAVAAAASSAVARPALSRLSIDRAAARALVESYGTPAPAAGGARTRMSAAQWIVDLVPPNPIRAAADDLMLPTIVFSVLFGFALSRVEEAKRTAVLRVVEGIADAMQRLVKGMLELAPVGVFALAVPLASRLGYAAAGAVGAYIGLVIVLTIAASALLLYPLGIAAGRMRPSAFAALCAPAQAVAFASRSSLAALPAMIESAERGGLPPFVTGVVLPLAASTFRFGAAVAQTVGVMFLARLYAIDLGVPQIASLVAIVVFTTFAVPGIPGGSILAMVPVLTTAAVPVEGIGILLAVDTIPDMFRTTANVTGSLAVAAACGGATLNADTAAAAETRRPQKPGDRRDRRDRRDVETVETWRPER